ncbi:predicted protein, partial [Nematostella vectensis]
FEYEAAEPDELSLQIDDIIEDIVDEDVGWARGDLNGKKGLFPVNFVDFIENNAELAKSAGKASYKRKLLSFSSTDSIAGRKACVLFDYEAENADELSLVTGIEINVIREVEDGWWEGTVDGRKGVFPSNFVKLKPIDETPTKTKRQPEKQPPAEEPVLRAKVTYDYEQQNEDELELKVGDIITIVKKEVFDTPGWMEGELDGKTGLFPDNFVEIL